MKCGRFRHPLKLADRELTILILKGATESTWDNVKSGSSKAYDDLKDGFQHARQWVSDKIAP